MMMKYLLAWVGMMLLAIINGGLREWLLLPQIDVQRAHQVSTLSLLLIFAVYFWLLSRRWPIASPALAWCIGFAWLFMTLAFEFGIGRMSGASWRDLFAAYDMRSGQLWPLVPLWVLLGPYCFHRLRRG